MDIANLTHTYLTGMAVVFNDSTPPVNRSVARLMYFQFEMSLCRWSNPVYGVISLPSVLLNGLALFLLCSIKQKKPIVHFLLSLVLADLIYPVINVFDIIHDPNCERRYYDRYYVPNPYTAEKCISLITSQLQFIGCYAMLGTMLGMTTDRIMAVLQPLRHRQRVTTGRVKTSIVCIWVLALCLSICHFIIGLAYDNERPYMENVEQALYYVTLPMLFTTACLTLAFLLGVYGLIFYQIKKTMHAMSKVQSTSIRKSCITIVLIVGTFALSWLPYGITIFWYTQNPCDHKGPNYEQCFKGMRYNLEITMGLVYLNALFDPIIYIVRDNYVNSAWKSLIIRWKICPGLTARWRRKATESSVTEMTSFRNSDSICTKCTEA